MRSGDGYFYAMIRAERKALQQLGTCLMRHPRPQRPRPPGAPGTEPGSRCSSATRTSRRINPAHHVCAPVDFKSIGTISESLTYNTYLRKWMLVGTSVGDPGTTFRPGSTTRSPTT